MKHILRCLLLLLAVWMLSSVACGGSNNYSGSSSHAYAQAGVIAGIAVTAAIIQAARSNAVSLKNKDQCCAVCDQCSFPCGNTCLFIGSICLKPDGCACYDSQLPIKDRPLQSDLPCANAPDGTGTNAVTVPMGVSY